MTAKKRNIENKIRYLLKYFPVVTILGARQTGKTTLSKQIGSNWQYFDLENPTHYDQMQYDPSFIFKQYPDSLIIDEAQELPELFKVLRGVIDEKRKQNGRFIITGSSSPALLSNISETLAGRVAIVELGTFKANEIYGKPLSPFYKIFENKLDKSIFEDISPVLTYKQLQRVWVKGGYPQPVLLNDDFGYSQWMDNYHDTYINRDIGKLFPKLNKVSYRRFLSILSKLSGTIINKQGIARDIEISESSIRDYLKIIEGTFIWRTLSSYEKNIRKSIIKMPKGYIRDTGLLHYLLKINDIDSLLSTHIVGNSFESFVIEEIIKGLQATFATNWDANYYRTRNGAEIDLILEGEFGTLPIEIKYGSTTKLKNLRIITDFVKENNLPFGILINQASNIEWLNPHIIRIPITYI